MSEFLAHHDPKHLRSVGEEGACRALQPCYCSAQAHHRVLRRGCPRRVGEPSCVGVLHGTRFCQKPRRAAHNALRMSRVAPELGHSRRHLRLAARLVPFRLAFCARRGCRPPGEAADPVGVRLQLIPSTAARRLLRACARLHRGLGVARRRRKRLRVLGALFRRRPLADTRRPVRGVCWRRCVPAGDSTRQGAGWAGAPDRIVGTLRRAVKLEFCSWERLRYE